MQASRPRSAHALALARVPDPHVARRRGLLLAAGLVLGLAPAPLAQQFQQRGIKGYLPVRTDPTEAVVLGDVDGDGDLDLLEGGRGGTPNALLSNDGRGRFRDASAGRITGAGAWEMRLGDVDGDGDLDLVWASLTQLYLHVNDGTGTFEDATASQLPALPPTTAGWYPELGDVDQDGDLDLAVGNRLQERLLLNDGSGLFTDVTASHLPPGPNETRNLAFADVDGDGDLDLLLGVHAIAQNRLYLNDGTGVFADATAGRMPPSTEDTYAIEVGDVDGDGDADAVCVSSQGRHHLYVNDGTGTFTDALSQFPGYSSYGTAAAFADLDDDEDLDLVITHGQRRTRRNELHLNDGTGDFTGGGGELPPDRDDTSSLAVGDVDADGDLDLVFGNSSPPGAQNRLFLNDGAANFVPASRDRIPHRTFDLPSTALALADLDADGDLDLLLGTGAPNRDCGIVQCGWLVEQRVNDGQGIFSDQSVARMPALPENCTALAAGDMDGDGDPDLVVGNSRIYYRCGGSYYYGGMICEETRPTSLYVNDGQGGFASAGALVPGAILENTTAIVLGDLDGDLDLDVLVGGLGEQTRLMRNEGGGVFHDLTATSLPQASLFTRALALLDVEADGDLDLVIGVDELVVVRNRLYLNDGGGVFADATQGRLPTSLQDTFALGAGDLDGDGDADLVVGRRTELAIQLNDGTGMFADSATFALSSPRVSSLALLDVEEDGDLDIWVGTTQGQSRLLVNDGTAGFTDETATRTDQEAGHTGTLVAGDLDGDGDVDLYEGSSSKDRILTNLHRQLGAPLYPFVGRDYEVVFDIELGYATTSHAAVAAIGTQLLPGPTTVPPLVGGLRLLPPVTLLPAALVPAAAGSVTLTQPIPPDPGLLGTLFHIQGVILGGDQHLRLTGYVQDRIRL